jgi:hypothetical protein
VPLLAFDCVKYLKPLVVAKYDGSAQYSIREINVDTGSYVSIANVTFADENEKINAVAMYGGSGALYAAFGAFSAPLPPDAVDNKLCNFDLENRACFAEKLKVFPNAGAIFGNDYYYAASLGGSATGSKMYWVENIDVTTPPVFHGSGDLSFKTGLFTGPVLDFAPITDDTNVYIKDKDSTTKYTKYLVGLTGGFRIVIIRVAANGAPNGYAVFASTVDWAGQPQTDITEGFGSAFTYNTATGPKALFASNDGVGLFEVVFPIIVRGACWNSGTVTANHKPCTTTTPTVIWRAKSVQSVSNDGKAQRRSSRQRPGRES